MKMFSQITVIALSILITHVGYSQNIWRVNNDDPTADFAELQDLFDDANFQAGDIVYLEGSGKNYAGATVNVKVTIIGPGYFLSENTNTQANTSRAVIQGDIIFEIGSENSFLIGVSFDDNTSQPTIKASNITVQRCYMSTTVFVDNDISGLVIKQCYLGKLGTLGDIDKNTKDIILTNCILNSNTDDIDLNSDKRSLSMCENNIFVLRDSQDLDIQTSSFRNNILLSQSDDVTIISNEGIQNNIAVNTQFGTENGNLRASYEDIFVGTGNGSSTDGQYLLKEGSPATGAGFGGMDIGIFGGDDPYILSGLPPVPAITEIRTSGVGNTQDGLKVNIKVKSN